MKVNKKDTINSIKKAYKLLENLKIEIPHDKLDHFVILQDIDEKCKKTGISIHEEFTLSASMDYTSLFIAAQVLIDKIVNMIIDSYFVNPKMVKDLHFITKLKIIYSLGLIDDFLYQDIKVINKTRNKLAHNNQFFFEDIKINDFTNSLVPNTSTINKRNDSKILKMYIKTKCMEVFARLLFVFDDIKTNKLEKPKKYKLSD